MSSHNTDFTLITVRVVLYNVCMYYVLSTPVWCEVLYICQVVTGRDWFS